MDSSWERHQLFYAVNKVNPLCVLIPKKQDPDIIEANVI